MNQLSKWLMARALNQIEGLERIMDGISRLPLTPAEKSAVRLRVVEDKDYCLGILPPSFRPLPQQRDEERESLINLAARNLSYLVVSSLTQRSEKETYSAVRSAGFCFYTSLGGAGSPVLGEDTYDYLCKINERFYAIVVESNQRRWKYVNENKDR